ncbi:hypothetical protein QFZ31_006343 [Neobacillus niacini]|nr:hypothetical protein [Neobacillus niacini]
MTTSIRFGYWNDSSSLHYSRFLLKKEASTIKLRKINWFEDLSTYLLHKQINFTLLPYPITFVLSFESVNFSFTKKKVSLGLHLSNSSYIAPLTKQCKGKTFTTRSQTERTRMVESPKKLIFIYSSFTSIV